MNRKLKVENYEGTDMKVLTVRPYIHINCASSLDGRISAEGGQSIPLSTMKDKVRVHILRKRYGALLVGINTVINDNPKLHINKNYVKAPSSRGVKRIILDSKFRIPLKARLFSYPGAVIIYTGEEYINKDKLKDLLEEYPFVTVVPSRLKENRLDLEWVLKDLYQRRVNKVLVEGGGAVIESFVREGLFDIMTIFYRSVIIGGVRSPSIAYSPIGDKKPVMVRISKISRKEGGFLVTILPSDH